MRIQMNVYKIYVQMKYMLALKMMNAKKKLQNALMNFKMTNKGWNNALKKIPYSVTCIIMKIF